MTLPGDNTGKPLRTLLSVLETVVTDDRITVGTLLSALGRKSTELVLILLSLPAIVPTPGVPAGVVFGLALSLVALQLLVQADRVSLPRRIERLQFSRKRLVDIVTQVEGRFAFIDRHLRQRWTRLLSPLSVRALALFLFLMGVIITLPIPFGNVLPGVASLLVAIGLTSRDGLVIVVGIGFGFLALSTSALLLIGTLHLVT